MFFCLALAFLAATSSHASDWPQFRGPTGLGYTDAQNLPLTWNAKSNVNIAWKAALPTSDNPYSSPVAQISNLLYRRFSTCVAPQKSNASFLPSVLPIANRRYSRLQVCATPLAFALLTASASDDSARTTLGTPRATFFTLQR